MENRNPYPNGWKDGFSSADHKTEDYSHSAWERAEREEKDLREERRFAEERQLEYERKQKEIENENLAKEAKREIQEHWRSQEIEEENSQLKNAAVNYIVNEKRKAYYQKNFLLRAADKLMNKDFNSLKQQIIAEAEKKVDNMDYLELEDFIESKGNRR